MRYLVFKEILKLRGNVHKHNHIPNLVLLFVSFYTNNITFKNGMMVGTNLKLMSKAIQSRMFLFFISIEISSL